MGDQDSELNENLGDFIDCLAAVEPKKDGAHPSWKTWTEDNWEEEFDKHPFFRKKPIEPGEELSEEMEAMMAIKWDIEDPNEKAEEFKKEGNQMFKLKKYRFSIISYTEGLRLKGVSKELIATLYSNRAASHCHLGNWRSALMDCVCARKMQPSHKKAIHRGLDCCLRLSMFAEAIKWCDAALILDQKDEMVQNKRKDAERKKKAQDRDNRKQEMLLKKERARKSAMIKAVKERGLRLGDLGDLAADIDLEDVNALDALDLSSLESHHPSGAQVSVNEDGSMTWPVMFLYPEHGESDFIQSYHETVTFDVHLEHMFSSENRPPWDVAGKYRADNLVLFYEDKVKTQLVSVKRDSNLIEVMKQSTFRIYGGTPTFIVLPNNCKFFSEYLKHYERATT